MLLIALVERPNRVLTRDMLMDLAAQPRLQPVRPSIDVADRRMRRKLEERLRAPPLIKTVRGAGYVFLPTVERC